MWWVVARARSTEEPSSPPTLEPWRLVCALGKPATRVTERGHPLGNVKTRRRRDLLRTGDSARLTATGRGRLRREAAAFKPCGRRCSLAAGAAGGARPGRHRTNAGNCSVQASPTRVLRPRGAPTAAGKVPARKAAPEPSRPAQLLAQVPQPAQASPPLHTAHLPGHPAEPHDAQFKVGHGRACALGRRSRSLRRLPTGPGRSEAAALRVRPGPGSGRAGRGRTRLGRDRATAAASRPPDLPRAAATAARTPASGAEGGA